MFATAVKQHENEVMASSTSHAPDAPDTHDDRSRDLFDDDDEIVPETQLSETEADLNESGESVRIPFRDTKYSEDSSEIIPLPAHRTDDGDGDDESELIHVHPESHVIEPLDEPQSQFLMANLDHSLIRDFASSAFTQQENTAPDASVDSTCDEIEKIQNENSPKNDKAEINGYDRSGSTTPDLDFLTDGGKTTSKEAEPAEIDGTTDDNQDNSEAFFEELTQVLDPASVRKAASTRPAPVFKLPAPVSSTPNVKTKSKPLNDSIFDAETQMDVEDEGDLFEAETQLLDGNDIAKMNSQSVNHRY